MIKCRQSGSYLTCNNCHRVTPLTLVYEFSGNKGGAFMRLCEDCSNAMANLHYKVMKTGKPHKYDMDEITEVTE